MELIRHTIEVFKLKNIEDYARTWNIYYSELIDDTILSVYISLNLDFVRCTIERTDIVKYCLDLLFIPSDHISDVSRNNIINYCIEIVKTYLKILCLVQLVNPAYAHLNINLGIHPETLKITYLKTIDTIIKIFESTLYIHCFKILHIDIDTKYSIDEITII